MEGNPSYTPSIVHDLEDVAVVGGKDDLQECDASEGIFKAIGVPDLESTLSELPIPPDAIQELVNRDHGPVKA